MQALSPTFVDVRDRQTLELLFRYDPVNRIVEVKPRNRPARQVDLKQYEQEHVMWDPAIYWAIPACFAEMRVHVRVLETDHQAHTNIHNELEATLLQELRKHEWAHIRREDQWTNDPEQVEVIVRRTAYECPLFQTIKRWHIPSTATTLHIVAQDNRVTELPLRKLMYYDESAYGALDTGTLHVAVPLVMPQQT
jgi:hypothetical protein